MINRNSILLVGGAGYIGSKIAHDLLDQNFKVYFTDEALVRFKLKNVKLVYSFFI